jgi:hypothetical protein
VGAGAVRALPRWDVPAVQGAAGVLPLPTRALVGRWVSKLRLIIRIFTETNHQPSKILRREDWFRFPQAWANSALRGNE